jgi:uncharacterized protein (AIM24 family)
MARIAGNYSLMQAVTEGANFHISGDDSQMLQLNVDAGKKITCETGSMVHMSEGMESDLVCGGIGACCARLCTGEGCCVVDYTNTDQSKPQGFIGLTPTYPAKIVPVDLANQGGVVKVAAGSYFSNAGTSETDSVAVDLDCLCCSPMVCCFGGQGCLMQKLSGSGHVFLSAGGVVLERSLEAGEVAVVDGASIVGFSGSVKMGVKVTNSCLMCCCGSNGISPQGLFSTTLTGPGKIWLQTMSYPKMKLALQPPPPPPENGGGGDIGEM